MPKKSFKSNSSKVFLKRKKSSQIIKNNGFDKRSSKFILVDGNNEKNWRYLKTETGYKSDTAFLEHLLGLAQNELNAVRQKKQCSNGDDETRTITPGRNALLKNKKKLCNGSIPAAHRVKLQAESAELEKAKEGKDLYVHMDKKITKKSKIINDDCVPSDRKGEHFQKGGLQVHQNKRKSNCVSEAQSKLMTIENSKSLAQNTKTDIAKDLVLENDALESKGKMKNLDSTFSLFDSNAKSSHKKEQKLENVSEESLGCFAKTCLPHKPDEEDSGVKARGGEKDVKEKRRRKKKNRELSLKFKKFQDLDESDSTAGSSLYENDKTGRVSIKIKLCLLCDSRHILGACPAREDKNFPAEPTTVGNLSEGPERSEYKNVYDFDESDKDGWGGSISDDSRWYPKKQFTDAAEKDSRTKKQDEDFDSDSSSSEKLRIDESFGENISFAESSLPDYLVLKVSDDGHGPSVFTKIPLDKGTHFGPLIGQKIKEMDIPDDFNMKDIWEVNAREGVTYLCTRDPESSNWLRYLRPAATRDSANISSLIKETRLYFLTTRDVSEGEELVYWMDDAHSAWSKKKLEKKNCGGCNLQFSHPLYYRKHCMIFHDPSCSLTIRKYHCKVCGVAVLGKEKIMRHAAEMHQGKGAYQCQFCHKFFLRLNYLEMHRTYGCSKNPQRSRPLCDLCGRKFCQPQKLKVHIKRMHSDMAQVLKDFQCKSCLKILGSRAALQRHMKEVHNKDIVGACTCDRCGKMFQNKSNLKIHMLTHSGVKPFKCQQADCTAAFTTKQCLQFHYKKVHGFADGFIPKIERSIAYTFDAYSGGAVSDPGRCSSSARSDLGSPTVDRPDHRGLDLSLGFAPAEDSRDNKHSSASSPKDCGKEDSGGTVRDEPLNFENHGKNEESAEERKVAEDTSEPAKRSKMMISKGSKKWLGSNLSAGSGAETGTRFKSIFRPENSDASLLVEAAISAAEKDMDEPCDVVEKAASTVDEDVLSENPTEIYSGNHYANDPSSEQAFDETQRLGEYDGDDDDDKSTPGSPKAESFQGLENKGNFAADRSNFNDILKCNTLLRINTSPLVEMPKDYDHAHVRENNESESFNELEIHDYRNNRDLLDAYKENDAFHEAYRNQEFYRNDKSESYRSGEPEFREYRDIDLSGECYRSLATNLEKYRNAEVYRLRSESYDLTPGYRDLSDERDGEVQNLCLKEKSLQYETLEELARIGRDNPGFECLLVGDSANSGLNQSLGVPMPRNLHGMLSPRAYHAAAYEPESVDLSVPRSSYPSPPIYTLDLTPARLDLSSRHGHIGLSPHRFSSGRVSVVGGPGSSPVSPTNYAVYPSPYASSATRPSPTSQFQPYASLYY